MRHTYDPKPIPNEMEVIFKDLNGHEYRYRVIMYGQSYGRLEIPMGFLTGEVGRPPLSADLRFYYEGRSR